MQWSIKESKIDLQPVQQFLNLELFDKTQSTLKLFSSRLCRTNGARSVRHFRLRLSFLISALFTEWPRMTVPLNNP